MSLYVIALVVTVYWIRKTKRFGDDTVPVSETKAGIRIFILVSIVFVLCLWMNFAFWAALLLIAGIFAFGFLVGGDVGGAVSSPILICGILIREFVLDFPTLVLRPEQNREQQHRKMIDESSVEAAVGKEATTLSALRPFGSISCDGQVMQAVSSTGEFIESDTRVRVTKVGHDVYSVERCSSGN